MLLFVRAWLNAFQVNKQTINDM